MFATAFNDPADLAPFAQRVLARMSSIVTHVEDVVADTDFDRGWLAVLADLDTGRPVRTVRSGHPTVRARRRRRRLRPHHHARPDRNRDPHRDSHTHLLRSRSWRPPSVLADQPDQRHAVQADTPSTGPRPHEPARSTTSSRELKRVKGLMAKQSLVAFQIWATRSPAAQRSPPARPWKSATIALWNPPAAGSSTTASRSPVRHRSARNSPSGR